MVSVTCLDDKECSRTRSVVNEFIGAIQSIEASDKPVYVDIQCLCSTEGKIIKEFAVSCEGEPTACITVTSPPDATPKVKVNRYLRNRVHGIDWSAGVIDEQTLRLLTEELFCKTSVCVKGRWKVKILKMKLVIPSIKVLRGRPRLQDLRTTFARDKTPCAHHQNMNKSSVCSMQNTTSLVSNYIEW